jgi:hypothetical protein
VEHVASVAKVDVLPPAVRPREINLHVYMDVRRAGVALSDGRPAVVRWRGAHPSWEARAGSDDGAAPQHRTLASTPDDGVRGVDVLPAPFVWDRLRVRVRVGSVEPEPSPEPAHLALLLATPQHPVDGSYLVALGCRHVDQVVEGRLGPVGALGGGLKVALEAVKSLLPGRGLGKATVVSATALVVDRVATRIVERR